MKSYVGISGVARSGKDTFFQLSSRYFYEEFGLSSKRYALADPLKADCRDFLRDKFNIDVYSQKEADKKIFRPLLVWFGDVKRNQTNGKYFTNIIEAQMKEDDVDIAFVTDIRYGEFPEDEVHWLKDHLGGKLVHVSRTDVNGQLVLPPNDNERRNDPILQELADQKICWPSLVDPTDPRFEDKMYVQFKPLIKQIYNNLLWN